MFLYWRIQKELNEMGNTLVFHHPTFIRAFEEWVKKNAGGLALAEDLTWNKVYALNSNLN